jgi:hypothetical protein
MTTMHSAAERFTERLDALAAALRDAGVDPERTVALLGAAAEATMHAITLDAMLEQPMQPEPRTQPADEPERAPVAETPIDIAA